MPARRRIFIFCTIAAFAALTNLHGNIVRHSHASGEKRARIECVEPAAAKQPVAAVKTEKPVAEAASQPAATSEREASNGIGPRAMKPLMRRAAAKFAVETRKAAKFIATLQSRGIDFVRISSRDPYLPKVGPADVRFESSAQFDRSLGFGLAAYNKMLLEKHNAEEAARAEEARRMTELETARKDAEAVHAVQQAQVAAKQETSANKATGQPSPDEEKNSLQNKDINPEALLHFFDADKNKDGAMGNVSFVMPFQSAPAPLVMESKATYNETKNPTEDNKPAK